MRGIYALAILVCLAYAAEAEAQTCVDGKCQTAVEPQPKPIFRAPVRSMLYSTFRPVGFYYPVRVEPTPAPVQAVPMQPVRFCPGCRRYHR